MPTGRLTASQRRAAEALKFADSYSRGDCLARAWRVRHPLWPEMLRDEWSCCDYFPPAVLSVLLDLAGNTAARHRAMTAEASDFLATLPERVTVYRGCYAVNARGYSWTTSRDVAAKFPFLMRYRRPGDTPLLIRGELGRADILFVDLGRQEFEVVALPGAVLEVDREPLAP
jgi:hypothetical protein